ncbi:MAG: MBL fold metallo-hydrolase [Eubacteriales bacterium]|nr:MBL fold metallo-hydrolase [Eubacteriales bacterium]
MERKRLLAVAALLALLLGFWILAGRLSREQEERQMTITAMSVGKADALIVETADCAVLIDAGEEDDGEKIVSELRDRGVERLDLMVVTHFDKDHVGGAAQVLEEIGAETVLMPDYEGDRPEYGAFLRALEGHEDARRVSGEDELTLGGMEFTVYGAGDSLPAADPGEEDDNDRSLVISLRYGESGFLFTGDVEEARIAQMLDSGTDWAHDWIKMPHHGRYKENLPELLEAVKPSWAVICCSEKHPAQEETLALLEAEGIPVWDTSEGAVTTVCDGSSIEVFPAGQR